MKKLALLLCMALIFGILGTGAFAKKDGNDAGRGKGYGRGGKYGQTESEGDEESETPHEGEDGDDGEDGEGEETEETEQVEETDGDDDDDGNGKALGNDKDTPKAPADYNGLNKPGKTRHLYLYEKNPEDWTTVEGGAWGKMDFRPSGRTFRFNFQGHGLEPGTDYTLIYYPDPWPGTGLVCLGTGTSNQGGQILISERVETADIPTEDDENEEGGKIWLVLSSDVDCEGAVITGWNPTEYLFEYNLITFENTADAESTEETEGTEE